MPGRRQQSAAAHLHAEDVGERYIPPPNAYPERTQRVVRTEQIAAQPAATQVTTPASNQTSDDTTSFGGVITQKLMKGIWSITGGAVASLIAYSVRLAQERAERAQAEPQAQPQQIKATSQASPAPKPIIVTAAGVSWHQQMYVYTILLLAGYSVWFFDGAFTVVGAITTLIPATLIGIVIAIAGHFFISWGQHTLIFHPYLGVKILGLLLLGVNATANIYGITGAAKALRPGMLGTLPDAPSEWIGSLVAWIGNVIRRAVDSNTPTTTAPPWVITAVMVLILSVVLAWYAEKVRDFCYAQWKAVWALRPH